MIDKKNKILIIDSSAILSGKNFSLKDTKLITTSGISNEFKPGGRDYNNFQFLIGTGLEIITPSKNSLDKINKISKKTGDIDRLSVADKEILAVALDLKDEYDVIILTDDYSIQNVANALNISFKSISQNGIKESFKWINRCTGCGKKFKDNIKICPICGSATKKTVSKKKTLKKM